MITFFEIITFLGSWKVISALALATLVILHIHRMKRELMALLVTIIIGEGIVLLLKILLQFPRPDTPNGALMMLEGDYSFPSGHTFMAVALYGFVIYLLSKHVVKKTLRWSLILALTLLIFFIGISRWYLGYHFAWEVAVSFVLGAAWLSLVIRWVIK